jgi:hypothetical protein
MLMPIMAPGTFRSENVFSSSCENSSFRDFRLSVPAASLLFSQTDTLKLNEIKSRESTNPVSYTHLTLPTKA